MSTGARSFNSALVLLALLAVANLGVIGSVETAALWVLFGAWAVLTVKWVVVPAARARRNGRDAVSGAIHPRVLIIGGVATLAVIALVATFPGQSNIDPGSTPGAAVTR